MGTNAWGTAPTPTLLTGEERIETVGASLRDFWAWGLSDLRANTVRSMLAEFLVARAVGAATTPRIEWDSHDVRTPDGITVEVKSGAYLQAWAQTQLSKIVFGGLRARTWTPEGGQSEAPSYNADAYVFAVLTATEHDQYDALDVQQWSFWVLSRDVVAATGFRSMSLPTVQRLAGDRVAYEDLPQRIREAGSRESTSVIG